MRKKGKSGRRKEEKGRLEETLKGIGGGRRKEGMKKMGEKKGIWFEGGGKEKEESTVLGLTIEVSGW